MPAYTDNSTPSSSLSTSWRRLVLYITLTCLPRRLPKFGPCGASTFCIHSFHEPLHFIQIGLNSSRFVFFAWYLLFYLRFSMLFTMGMLSFGVRFVSSFFSSLHRRFSISLFRMCTLLIVCASKWNENKSEWSTHVKYFWSDLCVCVDVFDDHSDELWDVRLGLCLLVLLIARNHFETLQWPDTQNYPIVERNPTKFKLGEEVKSYNHTRCQNKYWATF